MIGGRDQQQNEILVKKYLRPGLCVHLKNVLAGAPPSHFKFSSSVTGNKKVSSKLKL